MNPLEAISDDLRERAYPHRLVMDDDAFKPARTFSQGERQELSRLSHRADQYPIWLPVICWFWSIFSMAAILSGRVDSFQAISFGFLMFVCLSSSHKAIQARRLGSLVRSDLEKGAVIHEDEEGTEYERLPVSNLVWTVGGEPAAWRKSTR